MSAHQRSLALLVEALRNVGRPRRPPHGHPRRPPFADGQPVMPPNGPQPPSPMTGGAALALPDETPV
ncbi:hypothetical protein [uncultured Sphingomonas sp.]|uniref:hypothetical protein n=1 Tax=uncultured Sphingomonas sp. TaxID=158754 RepID=UPI0035C9C441